MSSERSHGHSSWKATRRRAGTPRRSATRYAEEDRDEPRRRPAARTALGAPTGADERPRSHRAGRLAGLDVRGDPERDDHERGPARPADGPQDRGERRAVV